MGKRIGHSVWEFVREPGSLANKRTVSFPQPLLFKWRKNGQTSHRLVTSHKLWSLKHENQSTELFQFLRQPRAFVAGVGRARQRDFRSGRVEVDSRKSQPGRGTAGNRVAALASTANPRANGTWQ